MEATYEIATEKVNEALETVKHDLMKVRNQDDQLMRQLLNINATIMQFKNRGHGNSKQCGQVFCSCGKKNCAGKRIISASDMRKIDKPIPFAAINTRFVNSTGSSSEYGSSDEDVSDFSDSDCDVFEAGNYHDGERYGYDSV